MATSTPNTSMDEERRAKFEKLKIEIRSILITSSKNGSTLAELEFDYEDLHPHKIPAKEFGFRDVQELLKAIPDVVEIRRAPDGAVKLFAISHESTRRIENLIRRQKPSRISRFGGTEQQQPTAEQQRKNAERRRIVEKRLVDIVGRSYSFIQYNDLCRKYKATYGEAFDPKVEFRCAAKVVFSGKLARYFTVVGKGSNFAVRLRDASRRSGDMVNGGNGSKLGGNDGYNRQFGSQVNEFPAQNRCRVVSNNGPGLKVTIGSGAQNYGGFTRPPPHQKENYQPNSFNSQSFNRNTATVNNARYPRENASVPQRFVPPRLAAASINQVNSAVSNVNNIGAQRLSAAGTQIQPSSHSRTTPISSTFPVSLPLPVWSNSTGPQHMQRPKETEPIIPSVPASTMPTVQQFREHVTSLLSKFPNGIELKLLMQYGSPSFSEYYSNLERFKDCCRNICDVSNVGGRCSLVKPKSASSFGPSTMTANATANSPPLKVTELKQFCHQVLQRYPSGITYLGFPKAFREISGRVLDLASFDLLSLSELVECFDDVFESQRINGEVLLFEKKVQPSIVKPTERKEATKQLQTSTAEDDLLFDEIWQTVMNTTDRSLYLMEIPYAYKIRFGKDFPVSNLDSFGEKLFEYTDRFDFIFEGSLKLIAYSGYKPLLSFENLNIRDEPKIGSFIDKSITENDLIAAREKYVAQDLPVLVEVAENRFSQAFELVVAQIETPACFYIQLKSNFEELEKLVNEMNDYYSVPTNRKTIPLNKIEVGMPCVCCYDEDQLWYRALVNKVESDKIMVSLVDYGTEIHISPDAVCYLVRRFFSLPSQAIKCRLAFLIPSGEEWAPEAGEILWRTCGSSVLYGEVYTVEDGMAHIFLTHQTEDGTDIYLNDILVEANLAIFDENEIANASDVAAASVRSSNDADVEDGDEDSSGSWKTINEDVGTAYGGQRASERDMADVDLSFEEDVINQLRDGTLNDKEDLEVVGMALTLLSLKRVNLTKKLNAGNAQLNKIIVGKVAWLEEQIRWLTECEKNLRRLGEHDFLTGSTNI